MNPFQKFMNKRMREAPTGGRSPKFSWGKSLMPGAGGQTGGAPKLWFGKGMRLLGRAQPGGGGGSYR